MTAEPEISKEKFHAKRRWRQVYKAAGATALGRAVSMCCTLAQVPIALHHLGNESFGLWMTLTGAVGVLNFADLGIGLGMQNKISEAQGQDNMEKAQDVFLTGFTLLGVIALVLGCLGILIGWGIDWASVFKIESLELRSNVRNGLLVVFAAFCLGFPLSAAQKLAVALQLGWLQAMAGLSGSVLSLLLVAIAALLKLSLIPFLMVALLPPVLINVGLLRLLFVRLGWRFDLIRTHKWTHVRDIFGVGTLFLIPQLASTLVFSFPAIILSSVLGVSAVVPYNLTLRLLSIITQVQGLLLAPLWPAYAEARARGDYDWIREAFRRSLLYSAASSILPCAIFALIGKHVILFWTHKTEALPSDHLIWFMSLWTLVMAASYPCAMFLNGSGRLVGQAVFGVITAILGLYLMPIFAQRYGPPGIPMALIISYVPFSLLFFYLESWYELRKLPLSNPSSALA